MAASARVLQLALDRPDPDALGGVAVHAAALCRHAPRTLTCFTAYPSSGDLLVEAWSPRMLVAALPMADASSRARALAAALAGTGAMLLHVHSPSFGPAAIVEAKRAAGARLTLSLHDHALVCENYELLEGGSRYCGIPADLSRCDRCLAKTRARAPGTVLAWREAMSRLVAEADAVVAPSRSVLDHAARVHPNVVARARHIPWGVPAPSARRQQASTESGPLRIAVVGVWATVKGAQQLPSLVAACRGLDVEWHLFGATEGASLASVERVGEVVFHGAYRRETLAERLANAGCHVVALPSVGAETFSLVLSEVVAAGFPVIASHLGALGERVSEGDLGWLFDPFDPRSFAAVVKRLAGDRGEVERIARHVGLLPRRDEAQMAAEHAELWCALSAEETGSLRPAGSDAIGPRREALEAFEDGMARARRRRPSRLDALFDLAKKTDFYRDLRLRKLLSEDTRKAIEHALRRPSYGARRAKDRR
ncbi:MAG TPA: glycosyltransferase [Polyangiaceae bacterium]|nr:glycosyltransferase [Polyangiaceae bacterium]